MGSYEQVQWAGKVARLAGREVAPLTRQGRYSIFRTAEDHVSVNGKYP